MNYYYDENIIEYLKNEDIASVTLTQKSEINRILKYAEEHPDECQIIADNRKLDGSIYAKVPRSWCSIRRPPQRNLSDEQRKVLSEQMKERMRTGE